MKDTAVFKILLTKISNLEKELREIKYAILPVESIDKELAEELKEIEERIKRGEFADESEIFRTLSE